MGKRSPGGCRGGSMAERSVRALQHLLVYTEVQQNQHRKHTLQNERRNFVQQRQELESTLVKERQEI